MAGVVKSYDEDADFVMATNVCVTRRQARINVKEKEIRRVLRERRGLESTRKEGTESNKEVVLVTYCKAI